LGITKRKGITQIDLQLRGGRAFKGKLQRSRKDDFLSFVVPTPHLGDGVRQQRVQLLVGAVSNSTPAGRVKVLPDAAQADGNPLSEQGVGVRELLQAVGDQVALQTGFLVETEG